MQLASYNGSAELSSVVIDFSGPSHRKAQSVTLRNDRRLNACQHVKPTQAENISTQ